MIFFRSPLVRFFCLYHFWLVFVHTNSLTHSLTLTMRRLCSDLCHLSTILIFFLLPLLLDCCSLLVENAEREKIEIEIEIETENKKQLTPLASHLHIFHSLFSTTFSPFSFIAFWLLRVVRMTWSLCNFSTLQYIYVECNYSRCNRCKMCRTVVVVVVVVGCTSQNEWSKAQHTE